MRYCNIIIYLLLFNVSKSQNLVSNPSFEILSSCPTGGTHSSTLCVNWYNPTQAGTPDAFSICGGDVPSNGVYYQWPRTGNSFAGIWCYSNAFTNLREYLHTNLNNTLIVNNYYLIKFYATLNDWSKYACNSLGLYFSSSSIYQSGASNYLLNYTSQIKKFSNPIISDTLNWVEISGIYKANGTENYITIGNFNNDNNTDTVLFNDNIYHGTYYFIDDVSVESICTPFWSYRDTTVTIGDSVLIGPAITGLNINWYDSNNNFIANAPAIYVKPNSPTYYTASEDFCNGITTHTINVMVTPTSVKDYNAFSSSISLFPNPTTNNFTISNLTESSKLKVDITDTQGKLCSTELITITNNKATIKTNLPNGIYFVSITDNLSGLKAVKKLIVQK